MRTRRAVRSAGTAHTLKLQMTSANKRSGFFIFYIRLLVRKDTYKTVPDQAKRPLFTLHPIIFDIFHSTMNTISPLFPIFDTHSSIINPQYLLITTDYTDYTDFMSCGIIYSRFLRLQRCATQGIERRERFSRPAKRLALNLCNHKLKFMIAVSVESVKSA